MSFNFFESLKNKIGLKKAKVPFGGEHEENIIEFKVGEVDSVLENVSPDVNNNNLDDNLKKEPVDLNTLPLILKSTVDKAIEQKALGVLLDDEEEESYLYLLEKESITEVSVFNRVEAKNIAEILFSIKDRDICNTPLKFILQNAFSDLGERLLLQMPLNSFDENQLEELKHEGIRMLNKLKPASDLTRKNRKSIISLLKKAKENKKDSFGRLLLDLKLITLDQLIDAEEKVENEKVDFYIIEKNPFPRKAFIGALGNYLEIPFVDVESEKPKENVAKRVSEAWSRQKEAIPFKEEECEIFLAMANPFDDDTALEVGNITGKKVIRFIASAVDILIAIDKVYKD